VRVSLFFLRERCRRVREEKVHELELKLSCSLSGPASRRGARNGAEDKAASTRAAAGDSLAGRAWTLSTKGETKGRGSIELGGGRRSVGNTDRMVITEPRSLPASTEEERRRTPIIAEAHDLTGQLTSP
jgi:hypothetical protein